MNAQKRFSRLVKPGDSISTVSANPAVNGDHLWLQLMASEILSI